MSTTDGDRRAAAFMAWAQSRSRDELERHRDELHGCTDEDTFRGSLSRIALRMIDALLMKREMRDALRNLYSGDEFEGLDADVLCDATLVVQSHRRQLGLDNDAEEILTGAMEIAQRRAATAEGNGGNEDV